MLFGYLFQDWDETKTIMGFGNSIERVIEEQNEKVAAIVFWHKNILSEKSLIYSWLKTGT